MFAGALYLLIVMTLYWYRCIVYWCSICLKGFCVCFLQGLSIGIDELFIGAPNVCWGFMYGSCNDSLLA